ncbi:CheR family methyltransferase [Emcibacter sp. SYSU 3D8]|uniref:CheR family methyltransferase n=1 Tax=Emcibacter sp. SYSU 3D8 TaxID=3133969 RepID=UPI0031FEDC53
MTASRDAEVLGTVRTLLHDTAGLDAQVMTESWLGSIIDHRLRQRGMDCAPWLASLGTDRAEQAALVERALVHETWFFRDVTPFDYLMDMARKHWLRRSAANPVRILSAPCASGEEAWSIAAALLAAGMAPGTIAVEAIDLSGAMVQTARTGVYGPRSQRNHHAGMLQPYTESLPGGGVRMGRLIRGCVKFSPMNLLHLPQGRTYDAVFCRNALMYMHEAARRRIVASISASLAPGAPLFVGHAEAAMLMGMGFRATGPSRAFCVTAPNGAAAPVPCVPPRAAAKPAAAPARRPAPRPDEPRPEPDLASLLDEAKKLADSGALAEAMIPLQRLLGTNPMCAQGHALAGLILAARGDKTGAVRHLRKALFLDATDEASRVSLDHLLGGRS